jgi:hypothetical protein
MPQALYRERFHIDHVIARQHGGADKIENLALACLRCNRHKGPNIAGIDPADGSVVTLFNPRKDRWSDHFQWHGPELHGLTAVGRTTIAALRINHPDRVLVREALMDEGVFPPL